MEPGELEGERRPKVRRGIEPLAAQGIGVDECRVDAASTPALGEPTRRGSEVGRVEVRLVAPSKQRVREDAACDRAHHRGAVAEAAATPGCSERGDEPRVEQWRRKCGPPGRAGRCSRPPPRQPARARRAARPGRIAPARRSAPEPPSETRALHRAGAMTGEAGFAVRGAALSRDVAAPRRRRAGRHAGPASAGVRGRRSELSTDGRLAARRLQHRAEGFHPRRAQGGVRRRDSSVGRYTPRRRSCSAATGPTKSSSSATARTWWFVRPR